MAIDRDQVMHVARLARLSLDDGEVERMSRDLARIVEYVDELAQLDLSAVSPTSHAALAEAASRPDQVKPCVLKARALEEAPRASADGFLVPGFVDES